jgi:hypothetical protein
VNTKSDICFNRKILTLYIFIALPVIFVIARYAFVGADDLTNAMQMIKLKESMNGISAINSFCQNIYWGWQGTFTSTFCIAVFQPYEIGGITAYRATLCILFVLYLFSFSFFSKTLIGVYSNNGNRTGKWFCLFAEIICLNIYAGSENYFWLTGVCVYTMPLAVALLGSAFFIKADTNARYRKLYIILSSLLGIVAAGGSLQITALVCSIYLSLFVVQMMSSKHSRSYIIVEMIPFLSALAGALINVCAPGNFKRSSGQLYIRSALVNSVYVLIGESKHLFIDYSIGIFVFLIFFIALISSNESTRCSLKKILLSVFICGSIAYISTFPVLLGYNSSDLTGSPRTEYMCALILGFSYLYLSYLAAIYIKTRFNVKITRETVLSVIIIAFLLLCSNGFNNMFRGLGNGMTCRILSELRNGDIQEAEMTYMSIYDTLRESKNQDVNLKLTRPAETVLYTPKIYDKEWWVNVAMSEYFGAKSLNVEWKE